MEIIRLSRDSSMNLINKKLYITESLSKVKIIKYNKLTLFV